MSPSARPLLVRLTSSIMSWSNMTPKTILTYAIGGAEERRLKGCAPDDLKIESKFYEVFRPIRNVLRASGIWDEACWLDKIYPVMCPGRPTLVSSPIPDLKYSAELAAFSRNIY